VIVGFAAETGDDGATPLDHAVAKLQRKGCDLLMCNEVGAGKVFGQDTNSGWMVFPDGRMVDVLPGSKLEVAAQIMDEVVELMPPLSS
jgi:DNA/pantothenate metabolism flavoprotein